MAWSLTINACTCQADIHRKKLQFVAANVLYDVSFYEEGIVAH